MPEVMRLNKLGTFSMAQLGQSKSAIAGFMKKRKEAGGAGFQDAMLKLLNTNIRKLFLNRYHENELLQSSSPAHKSETTKVI